MKENTPYKLTQQDEKIVHIFTELGMPKNQLKLLRIYRRLMSVALQMLNMGQI